MKTILVFLFALVLTLSSQAQLNITTSTRTDAVYNEALDQYDITGDTFEEVTFFAFSADFKMITHKTENITSKYVINSSTKVEGGKSFELDITSDIGTRYLMIIDTENRSLRFVYMWEGKVHLIQYAIKSFWSDKKA